MKPDDVSQSAWDAAKGVWYDNPSFIKIARAIDAAKAEAYGEALEACENLTTEDLPDDFLGRAASFGDGIVLAVTAIRALVTP